ncbi:MAG: hypothetical protein EXS00_09120 [Phycisphaerales bacterium]|nr:hypothetical protein [Phycisphaerales bacterium]
MRSNHPLPQSSQAGAQFPTPQAVGNRVAHPNGGRLKLLLGEGDWREDAVSEQLPPLLEPMGIDCLRIRSARAAAAAVSKCSIHIAVVDLSIPLDEGSLPTHREDAGRQVLEILRRLQSPPPVIVIRPPPRSVRDADRTLGHALRDGAFSVLDRPVPLEAMLEVLRRIVQRHYPAAWNPIT